MSRVITILMICVMPATMSVIRKRRRAIADFSRIYRRKGLQKEFIEQALLEEGNEDETDAIKRLLEKKVIRRKCQENRQIRFISSYYAEATKVQISCMSCVQNT